MTQQSPLATILSANDLARVERLAAESGDKVDLVVTRLGLCSEAQLLQAFSSAAGVPIIPGLAFPTSPILEDHLNPQFLRHARIIPIAEDEAGVSVAMADPFDHKAICALRYAVSRPVRVGVARSTDIEAAWEKLYDPNGASQKIAADDAAEISDDVERLRDMASEAPVIRFVNQLITQAVELRASDIHLEPLSNRLRVRFRLDGRLREMEDAPEGSRAAIISRLKIMARLNIAERRLAQDGRFRLALRGMDVDLRMATISTLHGEAAVLRILDTAQVELNLETLGFGPELLSGWRRLLNLPHGIVLVTGPTGSGKTTTLYSGLREINTADRKILSIEDPIELQLDGVNQVQVKPAIGFGFAQALRSFLRLDPNVILVGEIRDLETAQIAVQASLSGRLILSTLHTNDAASAITRLLDLGIDGYLLASTLHGILAQRLVRKLCMACRQPVDAAMTPEGYEEAQFYRATGCEACGGTGYAGRTVISELLVMSDEVRRLAMRRISADEIRKLAIEQGLVTIFADGVARAAAGVTTLDEVTHACMDG